MNNVIVFVRFLEEFYSDGEPEAVVESLTICMLLEVMTDYLLTGSRYLSSHGRVQDSL